MHKLKTYLASAAIWDAAHEGVYQGISVFDIVKKFADTDPDLNLRRNCEKQSLKTDVEHNRFVQEVNHCLNEYVLKQCGHNLKASELWVIHGEYEFSQRDLAERNSSELKALSNAGQYFSPTQQNEFAIFEGRLTRDNFKLALFLVKEDQIKSIYDSDIRFKSDNSISSMRASFNSQQCLAHYERILKVLKRMKKQFFFSNQHQVIHGLITAFSRIDPAFNDH